MLTKEVEASSTMVTFVPLAETSPRVTVPSPLIKTIPDVAVKPTAPPMLRTSDALSASEIDVPVNKPVPVAMIFALGLSVTAPEL